MPPLVRALFVALVLFAVVVFGASLNGGGFGF